MQKAAIQLSRRGGSGGAVAAAYVRVGREGEAAVLCGGRTEAAAGRPTQPTRYNSTPPSLNIQAQDQPPSIFAQKTFFFQIKHVFSADLRTSKFRHWLLFQTTISYLEDTFYPRS
jgi:hypothetical protein